ncbi:hypothetical protein [Mesorhizobium sp.]|uniref:hypothetical protein n=1 Tax=Mesorhizobium sp. TaxID=1871066 RepID=UPI001200B3D4|nr:hypothetical protein [Mesorhizobium sp.]TIO79435.1 MAG: hypothetical protein E5X75_02445 [Mesorhizobium sp.]
MTGRVGNGERDEGSSGDENGSGEGSGEATLVLTPSYRGERHERRRNVANNGGIAKVETVSKQPEPERIPSIDELDRSEVLTNDYTLGQFHGAWYLFDDDKNFVGVFVSREDAIKEAYTRKPPPRHGM